MALNHGEMIKLNLISRYGNNKHQNDIHNLQCDDIV